jgi:hypothetical protein
VKGSYQIEIQNVFADGLDWRVDHWNRISEAYRTAPYFKDFSNVFEEMYLGRNEKNLSKINFDFIQLINSILKIETPIHWSMDFDAPKEKSERLAYICSDLGATVYVSGESAKAYLNVQLFEEMGIKVMWADYKNYPTYEQLHPPFEHTVSVIDLIFNQGPKASLFLKEKLWM